MAPTAASCATRRGPCSLQDVKHGVAAQVGCLTPQGPERHDPEYVGEGQPGATTEPRSPRIMSRGIYRAKIATKNVGSVTNELSLFTLTLGLERRAQDASPMQNLKFKTPPSSVVLSLSFSLSLLFTITLQSNEQTCRQTNKQATHTEADDEKTNDQGRRPWYLLHGRTPVINRRPWYVLYAVVPSC